MDLSLLEKLLAVTGLGGFCVGVLLIIFKETLRAKFLSRLTKEHSYKIVKTIIWLTWLTAIFGIIAWASLGARKTQPLPTSISGPRDSQRPKLAVKLLQRQIPDNTPGAILKVATIHLEYIEVTGLGDKVLEKKINESIKKSFGVNEQYDGTEDLSIYLKSASLEDDLLSIVAEGTYYGHGAAGAANRVISVNINIRNGEPVQFKDLFRAGYQEKINSLAESWFITQAYEHSFEGVEDDQCFYFDGSYLYLCFSEYEVAPGSEGIVTVKINLEDVRGIISLNGPLAYAI